MLKSHIFIYPHRKALIYYKKLVLRNKFHKKQTKISVKKYSDSSDFIFNKSFNNQYVLLQMSKNSKLITLPSSLIFSSSIGGNPIIILFYFNECLS